MKNKQPTPGTLHSITSRDTALLTFFDLEPQEAPLAADRNGIYYMEGGKKTYLPNNLQLGLINR